ncbi:transcriptional regulator [Solibacillus sp. R5-41]|uniref:DUF2087 domain-containing protein n=1 Tax=Solibacillus sp. R5-41 TaxID=2048654 RepID=UPI000C127DA0|nr:DUF2087 domain-containing protein [Solibacillus sp. R5-41]ATP40255.1 transcriptional regulator [Solibacillus sp. R5-41]
MDIETLSIEQLVNGYVETDEVYSCLFCEKQYDKFEVYPVDGRFFTAQKMIYQHHKEEHGSVFDALIQLDKKHTGLSDIQIELLTLFAQGLPDKEIVQHTSANSVSTIRQHRFKLKEKEKQAKVFLAIMQVFDEIEHYEPIHKGAKQVDERFAITADEKKKVLETYYKEGLEGAISTFPSKEKRKIILLQQIMTNFEAGKKYLEKELNDILKPIYSDYVTIRRYLIQYGFMERTDDCAFYWVKEN